MDVYDILSEVARHDEPSVLATVIYVEGHAYRKAGAMMLLRLDGTSSGSISPGCLEADLFEYVPAVWDSKRTQVVEYDMRPADDFGWGRRLAAGD
ncbi:XdhC family protein [Paenibacillus hexagrammi]|uniref:XdhC family protein n=1 Tax=Paenibacillus hexagrammi TaxID=2908839 RepID=A0ABY3SFC4_9BACL|nr:XdhC family protein [Paenibacillus sp. YPD9-1]UJF32708.1 XdhC family protein [Paenibacillus sp. YPD9-1]